MSEPSGTQASRRRREPDHRRAPREAAALRELGHAFPNDFRRDALAADLHEAHDGKTNEELELRPSRWRSPAG